MTLDSRPSNGKSGKVVSINTSGGGVPKRPLLSADVRELGLEGDAHNDRNHGGPDRAVCIYSLELIQALRKEGHPIDIGTAGENFTIAGMDWSLILPGVHLRVGGHLKLEVVSFTNPCKTIASSFLGGKFSRISEKLFPGWSRAYARVLEPGTVFPNDDIFVIQESVPAE